MHASGFITKKTKIICLLIFLCHLLVSHVALPMLNKVDLYPFYTWNLFSFTPSEQDFYFIRIHAVDGQKLVSPQLVFRNRDIYKGETPHLVPHQIRKLGSYLTNAGDQSLTTLFKAELENNIFKEFQSVVYEVAVSRVNLRELVKNGQVEPYNSLGIFEYKRQGAK